MLEMLLNIDMSCGFYKKSINADVAEISKCCKCCRILICLVDFGKHQMLEIWWRFQNVANVSGY